jgi:hypothetical protein
VTAGLTDRQEAFAVALRSVAEDPEDERIPVMAHTLSIMATMAVINDRVLKTSAGTAEARASLKRAAKQLETFFGTLKSLGFEAQTAISLSLHKKELSVSKLNEALAFVESTFSGALLCLNELPASRRKKDGRPANHAANRITQDAAECYLRLSGKNPTLSVDDTGASGRWLVFLSSIFDASGISASPEAAHKAFKKAMEETRTVGE